MTPEIITTADGSHSLRNNELNETYHSVHGAIQESIHVFLKNGLEHFVATSKENAPVRILEVGFGTGLNAWLTAGYAAQHGVTVDYFSLEAFPLSSEIVQQLNYPLQAKHESTNDFWNKIHAAPWDVSEEIHPGFRLEKKLVKLQDADFTDRFFDVIYFDAFAPTKQPELWELAILEKMAVRLNPAGIFVTYCAKGQLKRDLKSLGLAVETLQGPPGKKEMVRAVKYTAQ